MKARVLLLFAGSLAVRWRGATGKWVEHLALGEVFGRLLLIRCRPVKSLLLEHHLLVRPLCSKLGVRRVQIRRLIRLWGRLLGVVLIKGRIKGRRRNIRCPASLSLLLDGVWISSLLLREQELLLLLLLMQELLLLMLLLLVLLLLMCLLLLGRLRKGALALAVVGGGCSLAVVVHVVKPVRSCHNGHGLYCPF